MREVVGGLPIAPGQTVKFDPSEYHLMFIGPTRPFKVGDHVPVTLRFTGAGEAKVEFYVQAQAPQSAGDAHMDMR
jgi:copper(I)-binding protein